MLENIKDGGDSCLPRHTRTSIKNSQFYFHRSQGASEGFKDYAQKWRDLDGRVQPPLSDRELVDMFLGTLSGPFFNHLIGSSSSGVTELILIGKRVEAGIRSGKIQKDTSSSAVKKPFTGKKEASVVLARGAKADLNNVKQ